MQQQLQVQWGGHGIARILSITRVIFRFVRCRNGHSYGVSYIKHRRWDSTVAEQSLLGHEFRGSSEVRGPLHGSIPYLRRHSVGLFEPEWFRELGGLLRLFDMRGQGTA
jgi:hypothetical protein